MRRETVLEPPDIDSILYHIANEIATEQRDLSRLALVGIHTRGVFLADRLRALIGRIRSVDVAAGNIDINLYRDDWTRIAKASPG